MVPTDKNTSRSSLVMFYKQEKLCALSKLRMLSSLKSGLCEAQVLKHSHSTSEQLDTVLQYSFSRTLHKKSEYMALQAPPCA